MNVLHNIEPKEVFRFFEEISSIPRPSYKEKAISDYLVNFAQERGLQYWQDDLYNVVMIKEATPGYETEEPIILQGHMDMVCEKENGCNKDMEKEGLDLAVEGDYVYAKGTTLGGDDGIAVAFALAILDSDSIKHPRLEFVCTVSEEVGMDGAKALDVSMLKGHLLLNMDSEEEGTVLAGCAGGGSAEVNLSVNRENFPGEPVVLHIAGLSGGHSGTEINKGRANSTLLLARVVRDVEKNTEIRLSALESGSKDNAIPREAKALIWAQDIDALKKTVEDSQEALKNEYSVSDPGLIVEILPADAISSVAVNAAPLNLESSHKVLSLIQSLPNGVMRMSDHIERLVETSLNMGVAGLNEAGLTLRFSIRSSVGSAYADLKDRVLWIAKAFGAEASVSGEYPAWEYVEESVLREKMARIYKDMFGKELIIEAIHAGVECGLLADKISGLDAVSMGPDILDIHTSQEKLSISSTKRMYDYVVRILEEKKE